MKTSPRSRLVVILALAAGFLASSTDRVHAVVIGGWDLARGGVESIAEAPEAAPFRALIEAIAPGAVLTSTNQLTPAYLATIDVLLIGAQNSNFTHITPLSAAEQAALFNFVAAGGNAGILTEREPQGGAGGDAARESMLDPFGIDTAGDLLAPTATFTNPAHPVANGPFGTFSQFALQAAGGYTNLGPYATALATDDGFNQPVLAVIERDAIAPGSGRALFLADAHTSALDALNVMPLFGNGYAYLIPEPSTMMLAAAGLLAISLSPLVRWRNRLLRDR